MGILSACHVTRYALPFAVILSAASPVFAQERFDLICSVEEVESFHPDRVSHYQRHVSVDLSAGEFCIWACDRPKKLSLVTDDEIRLFDEDSSFMRLETSIDRHTWIWKSHARIKEFIASGGEARGPCKLVPFTPFPAYAKRAR
jgi:hypothetical protein